MFSLEHIKKHFLMYVNIDILLPYKINKLDILKNYENVYNKLIKMYKC